MKMKRVWHKDLIHVLPDKVLLRQWRECCVIARNKVTSGSVGGARIRRIEDYPKWHMMQYYVNVCVELEKRGHQVDRRAFFRWFDRWHDGTEKTGDIDNDSLFREWHSTRYLVQCWYDLQEMFDCGEISGDEFNEVSRYVWEKAEGSEV